MFQEWDWLIGSAQHFGTHNINVGEKLLPQPKFSSCFPDSTSKEMAMDLCPPATEYEDTEHIPTPSFG